MSVTIINKPAMKNTISRPIPTRISSPIFIFLSYCALIISCFPALLVTGCGQTPSTNISAPGSGGPRLEKIDNTICRDTLSGLMWQTSRSRKISSIQKAKQYTSSLRTGGFNDWRLPSQGEFYTLHILFFLKKNDECKIKYKGSYWSEKPGEEPRPGRWSSPDYTCGPNFDFEKTKTGFVRAVRP